MPVRPLSPELAEKARVELGETPKKLEDSIQHLKEWIAKQPHLRARTDDQWLAAFLRGCKFSLERAKEKIDLFYAMRTIASDLITLKHTDEKFKEILKLGILLPLPKVSNPADPRVLINRSGLYEPHQYMPWEIMSVGGAIQMILMVEDDNMVVSGSVNIMDLKNATMAHFTAMTPLMMKKMVVAGQDAVPVRFKAGHVVNAPKGFETFFNLVKSFLNEKNRNRFFIYGKDFEAITDKVSKDILPVEYGGNGGTTQEIVDYWVKKVEEYSEWLTEDQQFGTDESKRPGKARTAEDMFGIDGSFRQLEFD